MVKVKREEDWGTLFYDTDEHRFIVDKKTDYPDLPYVSQPVVLNCYLTFKCNMACKHCLVKEMRSELCEELHVTRELIRSINESPFVVVVITGGEPLLKEYEEPLLRLIKGIKGRGIIVDTNGITEPSKDLIESFIKKRVLVRVSIDAVNPNTEIKLRRRGDSVAENRSLYEKKTNLIRKLVKSGVPVAAQSVLYKTNFRSLLWLPEKLKSWSVNRWYVQKFVTTNGAGKDKDFILGNDRYEKYLTRLEKKAKDLKIVFFGKKDRRDNSVFLLTGDSQVFTQCEETKKKENIGRLGEIRDYFEFVSRSEHSTRYYDVPRVNEKRKGK